jgi:hypothetical protein
MEDIKEKEVIFSQPLPTTFSNDNDKNNQVGDENMEEEKHIRNESSQCLYSPVHNETENPPEITTITSNVYSSVNLHFLLKVIQFFLSIGQVILLFQRPYIICIILRFIGIFSTSIIIFDYVKRLFFLKKDFSTKFSKRYLLISSSDFLQLGLEISIFMILLINNEKFQISFFEFILILCYIFSIGTFNKNDAN